MRVSDRLMVVSVESRRLDFDWLMVQTGESLISIQPFPPGSRLDPFLSSYPVLLCRCGGGGEPKGQFFGAESFYTCLTDERK